jgi:hypothetical protein
MWTFLFAWTVHICHLKASVHAIYRQKKRLGGALPAGCGITYGDLVQADFFFHCLEEPIVRRLLPSLGVCVR